jgi:hypothetical protein
MRGYHAIIRNLHTITIGAVLLVAGYLKFRAGV